MPTVPGVVEGQLGEGILSEARPLSPQVSPNAIDRSGEFIGAGLQDLGGGIQDVGVNLAEMERIALRRQQDMAKIRGKENYSNALLRSTTKVNTDFYARQGTEADGVAEEAAEWYNQELAGIEFENELERQTFMSFWAPHVSRQIEALSRYERQQISEGEDLANESIIVQERQFALANFNDEPSIVDALNKLESTIRDNPKNLPQDAIDARVAIERSQVWKDAIILNAKSGGIGLADQLFQKYRSQMASGHQQEVTDAIVGKVQDDEAAMVVEDLMIDLGRGSTIAELKRGVRADYDTDDPVRGKVLDLFDARIAQTARDLQAQEVIEDQNVRERTFAAVEDGDVELALSILNETRDPTRRENLYDEVLFSIGGKVMSTPIETRVFLDTMASEHPLVFRDMDLTKHKLSTGDRTKYGKLQGELRSGFSPPDGYFADLERARDAVGISEGSPEESLFYASILREADRLEAGLKRRLDAGEWSSLISKMSFRDRQVGESDIGDPDGAYRYQAEFYTTKTGQSRLATAGGFTERELFEAGVPTEEHEGYRRWREAAIRVATQRGRLIDEAQIIRAWRRKGDREREKLSRKAGPSIRQRLDQAVRDATRTPDALSQALFLVEQVGG